MEDTFADPGFGLSRYLSLIVTVCYLIRDQKEYLLCNGSDLRDFAGI